MQKTLKFGPLYTRDSYGRIRKWYAILINHKIITFYGLIDGKLAKATREVKVGKNLGKSNETTQHEQAKAELKSEVQQKIKEGYRSLDQLGLDEEDHQKLDKLIPKNRLDANDRSKPMKAVDWVPGKFKYPAYLQRKLDGVRSKLKFDEHLQKWCILSKEGLFYAVDHILAEVEKAKLDKQIEYDGELYIHGVKVTSIGGAARNPKNPLNKDLEYHIYDVAEDNLNQHDRFRLLLGKDETRFIKFVDTFYIENEKETLEHVNRFIEEGYEGGILRNPNGLYGFGKRSSNLMKVKFSTDSEFKIVDIVPWDKKPHLSTFVLQNDLTNETFRSNPEGTESERAEYLTNKHKYIGKMATVKYYSRTETNLPFHSNVIAIRDYE